MQAPLFGSSLSSHSSPLPDGAEPPVYPLDHYKSIRLHHGPGISGGK
jgi:hypothetical protein